MESMLEVAFEYQSLLAARARCRGALSEEETLRLAGLRRLLRGELLESDADVAGRMDRHRTRAPAEFSTPLGFERAELRDVCAGGAAVVARRGLPVGERTLLRVVEESTGSTYTFPARVVWRSATVMGLAFDGMPSHAEGTETYGRWGGGPPTRALFA